MEHFSIIGKIVYQSLGPGFWGIIDNENQKWRPVVMPEQLKKSDLKVKITAEKSSDEVSMFMWGTSIKIINFKIL